MSKRRGFVGPQSLEQKDKFTAGFKDYLSEKYPQVNVDNDATVVEKDWSRFHRW